MTRDDLASLIRKRAEGSQRFLVALAGPPGSGKSTLAVSLADAIPASRVVPMDGFHYDNAVLIQRGLLPRKGAPDTFDAEGFIHLMRRLRSPGEVAIPVFDRAADLSRAGADVVVPQDRILIVEGNYLLLDDPRWKGLAGLFDLTVYLDVEESELERRLVQRWLDHGLAPDAARARALGNDIPNARLIAAQSRPADIRLR